MYLIPQIRRFCLTTLFCLCAPAFLAAQSQVGFAGKSAGGIENKRVEQKKWDGGSQNSLTQKTFPLEKWDKHFSSLGSKRSAIDVESKSKKQIFETETKSYPKKEYEMSRWNDRVKDLQKEARLVTDPKMGTLKKATDEKLYSAMLQDTQHYADMAEELSLRDLNKFQFRRNHSDGPVPIQKAGRE